MSIAVLTYPIQKLWESLPAAGGFEPLGPHLTDGQPACCRQGLWQLHIFTTKAL